MKHFILILILVNTLFAEELLLYQIDATAERDYSFKNKAWGDGLELDKRSNNFGVINKQNTKKQVTRNYVFSKLDTTTPLIKVIANYNNPKQEIVTNIKGKLIHVSKNFILVQWGNFDYNIWIASISLKYKKATISNYYDGIYSYGITTSSLDCK